MTLRLVNALEGLVGRDGPFPLACSCLRSKSEKCAWCEARDALSEHKAEPKDQRKPVCPECGSDDVYADAYVAWVPELKDWVAISVFEEGNGCVCNTCDERDIEFDWIDAAPQDPIQPHTACGGLCILAAKLTAARKGSLPFSPHVGDTPLRRGDAIEHLPALRHYYEILDRLTEGKTP